MNKSYCYKDMYNSIDADTPIFYKGKLYECNFIHKPFAFVKDDVNRLNGYNTWIQFSLVVMARKDYFYDYFYSEQEFRNFKLKKLKSIC